MAKKTAIEFEGGFKLVATNPGREWVLYKTHIRAQGDKIGEPYDEVLGYYGTIPMALPHLLNHKLGESQAESVAELAQVVTDFRKELQAIFDLPKVPKHG